MQPRYPTGQVAELMAVSKPVSEWVDVFGVLESAEEELPLDEVERKLEFLSWRGLTRPRRRRSPPPLDEIDIVLPQRDDGAMSLQAKKAVTDRLLKSQGKKRVS
jgi:hypothetical protein